MQEKKGYGKAIDISFAMITFIFLTYLLGCWLISFHTHLLWVFLMVLNVMMMNLFWKRLTNLIANKITCFVLFTLCLVIVAMLFWRIGYFPISTVLQRLL